MKRVPRRTSRTLGGGGSIALACSGTPLSGKVLEGMAPGIRRLRPELLFDHDQAVICDPIGRDSDPVLSARTRATADRQLVGPRSTVAVRDTAGARLARHADRCRVSLRSDLVALMRMELPIPRD